ncbi:MAG: hypothetical protein ABEJ28_03105 [Salinigranum sp.]
MTGVDHAPTRFGTAVAGAAGVVALGAGGLYSWQALGIGAAGIFLLAAGLAVGRRGAVTLGAAALFADVVLAGATGAPVVPVLVGTVAAVVAWDVGLTAIGLGEQLGRAAPTTRLEAVHAGVGALVGAATAGLGYGVYRTASGGQPLLALVLLLLAGLLLASALR